MGWQITNNVVQGQRYRFAVQQPTTGSWSGDVQGSLQSDWAFDLVGNSFELYQVGSSGTWVAQGIANRSWTVPLSPQTVSGFTYMLVAAQARDDLTRLVRTGTSYAFDVRVPASWTAAQTATYLQGKGWSAAQVAAVSDVMSLLASMPDSVAATTAFSVAATWNGADKTTISDSDGTINYGAFSNQPLASTSPTTPVSAAVSTSSSTAWIIGLGVAGVAGLGLVLLMRSKPTKNPWTPPGAQHPVIEYRIKRTGPPYWPWSVIRLVREPSGATHQEIVFGASRRAELTPSGKQLVNMSAAGQKNSPNVVRLLDENGRCIHAARNKMIPPNFDPKWGKLGERWLGSFEEVSCSMPLAVANPVGKVFIYDPDALDKLAELEGQRWLADDLRMWQQYRSGNTAHAFQFAWWETHKPGVLGPQDLPFWKDYFAGDMGIELGVIYGDGGYARFMVTDAGEIVLEASSTRKEKVERAEQIGFRVVR